MPAAGGGFDQCYNAQAAVAAGSLLVVATDVVQAPNDKNQVEPMLEKIGRCPKAWARSNICWPTPAISARATWLRARRPAWSLPSRWAASRIIRR